jgi:hypothetical protein
MPKTIENYNPAQNGWKKIKTDGSIEVWEKLKNGSRVDVTILQKSLIKYSSNWYFSSWKINEKSFRNKRSALNFAKEYRRKN